MAQRQNDLALRWVEPEGFDPATPGLGLARLDGARHSVIYNPEISYGNVDEGGDGRYESLFHGSYVHAPRFFRSGRHVVANWNQHSRDEAGTGTRSLAMVGTISDAGDEIQWNGDTPVVCLSPQGMLLRRRETDYDPDIIRGGTVYGSLFSVGERCYQEWVVFAIHGATDDPIYHYHPEALSGNVPVPAKHYSDHREDPFRYGVYLDLGVKYFRAWKFTDDGFAPDSDIYVLGREYDEIEITPGRTKSVERFLEPYASARPIESAPEAFRLDIESADRVYHHRRPVFAPGTERLAADGIHGLAHHTQFLRRDGACVVVRDNVLNIGTYYAVAKQSADDPTPPAAKTNLPGDAMPVAGELSDGSVWFIGNVRGRRDMYLAYSKDGVIFDRSWSLLTIDRECDGGLGKGGGPQYFQATQTASHIHVVYSITKEQIGLTTIPIAEFRGDSTESG